MGRSICSPRSSNVVDLSPRRGDRLQYCTNTGSIPSNNYFSDQLKQLKSLCDEHTKSLRSPSLPMNLPKIQSSTPSVFLKKSMRFLKECLVNQLNINLQSRRKHLPRKFQTQLRLFSLRGQRGSRKEIIWHNKKGYSWQKSLSYRHTRFVMTRSISFLSFFPCTARAWTRSQLQRTNL